MSYHSDTSIILSYNDDNLSQPQTNPNYSQSMNTNQSLDSHSIINHDTIRHQLLELGYHPDSLPTSILDQFVNEIRDWYDQGGFQEMDSSQDDMNNEQLIDEHPYYEDDKVNERAQGIIYCAI